MNTVSFSRNGHAVLSGSDDTTINVYDIHSGSVNP